MLSIVYACALIGLDGHIVEVQTDFNPRMGQPMFTIVGLPGSAVKESRDRVKAAIKNSRMEFPNKGYTVNLFPADLPKQGPAYDLAIAMGVLGATDQAPPDALDRAMFVGELSLNGMVRHVKGIMPITYTAMKAGFERIYVPAMDAPEAALVHGIEIYPIESLGQLVEHLFKLNPIQPFDRSTYNYQANALPFSTTDFSDIRGQEHIKRGLEIAAAGSHNILMKGSPGVGKSLMARAMPSILPTLAPEEALEVTRIYSIADMLPSDSPLFSQRPFRAPHHTISQAGLVGGGSIPKPGEISLSHRGVLFMDEIVEFSGKTLEVLRQPIEDKIVTISRAAKALTFPANFLLVAAMNPCPCGYFGDSSRACTCSPTLIKQYQGRLSGPLLDRIDIHLDVPRVEYEKLMGNATSENSATVRERVQLARARQVERFKEHHGMYANSDMQAGIVQQLCPLTTEAKHILEVSVKRLQLSARSYHRILKLSRTIADLANEDLIQVHHVAEALQYRPKQLIV